MKKIINNATYITLTAITAVSAGYWSYDKTWENAADAGMMLAITLLTVLVQHQNEYAKALEKIITKEN